MLDYIGNIKGTETEHKTSKSLIRNKEKKKSQPKRSQKI